jgi:hypothetical protein
LGNSWKRDAAGRCDSGIFSAFLTPASAGSRVEGEGGSRIPRCAREHFLRRDSHVDHRDCFAHHSNISVGDDFTFVGCLDKRLVQTFGDVLRCVATSARFFRYMARSPRAKSAAFRRTFGRRHRHIGIGDFSAQYLNGRRQAMIFRLRGVALFKPTNRLHDRLSSTRTSRPERGQAARRSRCRLLRRAVLRRLVRPSAQMADTRPPNANEDIANSC